MKPLDAGRVFGRWRTLGEVSVEETNKELVECSCGTRKFVERKSLIRHASLSCGCLRNERRREAASLHGASTTDYLYKLWNNVMTRCYNKAAPTYKWYGGKGVSVFEPWHMFSRFAEDLRAEIGDRPGSLHSLDRIDGSRGYEPGNLRWATQAEQNRNTSRNRLLTLDGETLTITDWALRLGVVPNTISGRLKAGWPLERALKERARTRA